MNDLLDPDDPRRPSPTVAADGHRRSPADAPSVDVAAYCSFYRDEITGLVNFLLWMGSGVSDAADLAQETMIDAYRSWQSIHHPRAWIRRVASRKFARHCFNRNETSTDLDGDTRNPLLGAPDGIAAWEQQHEVLRLLASLPWRQRQVMAWSFDGYQPHEIAAELNIDAGAVRSSLKIARRALAAKLDQAGGTV